MKKYKKALYRLMVLLSMLSMFNCVAFGKFLSTQTDIKKSKNPDEGCIEGYVDDGKGGCVKMIKPPPPKAPVYDVEFKKLVDTIEARLIKDVDADLNDVDISKVDDLSCLFGGLNTYTGKTECKRPELIGKKILTRFNGDISKWDVSHVKKMSFMFQKNYSFQGDLSGWNMSNVEDVSYMFANSRYDGNISGWKFKNLKNMKGMFSRNKTFNRKIGGWNTSNVTNMQAVFFESTFNQDISGWDVSNVTTATTMFYLNSDFNQDLDRWNVRKLEKTDYMFFSDKSFSYPLPSWGAKLPLTAKYEARIDRNLMFSGSGVDAYGKFPKWCMVGAAHHC